MGKSDVIIQKIIIEMSHLIFNYFFRLKLAEKRVGRRLLNLYIN